MNHFDLARSPLEGRNLIEASAGTGKTYTIAALFLRLLLEQGLEVGQILVVTFTEAATEELRDRIRQRIRDALVAFDAGESEDDFLRGLLQSAPSQLRARALLRRALVAFDEAAIYTIHGFCRRVIQDRAFSTGMRFDTELLTDASAMLLQIVRDFWRLRSRNLPEVLVAHLLEKKIGIEALCRFLRGKLMDEGPQVLPLPAGASASEAHRRCRSLFAEAEELWGRDRAEILALLEKSPHLNRRSYRKDYLASWSAQLEDWFERGEPAACPEKALERFGHQSLEAATKEGGSPPRHGFFETAQQLFEELEILKEALRLDVQRLKLDCLSYARQQLEERKGAENVRFFDDLLTGLKKSLEAPRGDDLASELRRRYPAALIDEFQDTDCVQYRIFSRIYPDCESLLFFIGDPKQAIYSFRGADIYAYLEASRQVDARYSLGTNFRSTPSLVQAVNCLFGRHPNPFVSKDIVYQQVSAGQKRTKLLDPSGEGAALRFWLLPQPENKKSWSKEEARELLARATAREIAALLQQAGDSGLCILEEPSGQRCAIGPGDLAVLVRSHREARIVQRALLAWRIPSVLQGTGSLYASQEARELLSILRAILSPGDEPGLRAALVTSVLGRDARELDRLSRDSQDWDRILERFDGYHQLWRQRGLFVMASKLLLEEEVRERLLALQGGERRLTNLLHCLEVLHQHSVEARLGPRGELLWFARQIEEQPDQDQAQMRLETDDAAVKIVTIHKSKGLEYPLVFCPFCWGGSKVKGEEISFHDGAGGDRLSLDLGTADLEAHREQAQEELLAENMRLLYVALTRARYRCYLGMGNINESESSALAWLLSGGEGEADPEAAALELVADSRGTISAQPLPAGGEPVPYRAERPRGGRCREFSRTLEHDWRIASFTLLTARATHGLEGPGWDEISAEQGAPGISGSGLDDLFDFPKGATPGTCLHEILERFDFTLDFIDPARQQEARLLVAQKLEAFGIESRFSEAVLGMLRRLQQAPLPGPDGAVRLGSVPWEQRLSEMEFHFPLRQLRSEQLRTLFDRHANRLRFPGGGDWLSSVDFPSLQGVLKGYIDLVFESAGRFYVVDWKSNYLGQGYGHYGPENLLRSMKAEHYILQYHLYSLALHRYLKQRLPGYMYETHFGGVFYLYLRGVREDCAETGIFSDRPPRELMDDLERLLCPEPCP